MTEGPVEVVALRPIATGTVLSRLDGSLQLTIIVKATFGMVHDGLARLIAPLPLVTKDHYRERSPARSLEAASELDVYLPRAGVVLSGHAYAPPGREVPAVSVRLAVGGGAGGKPLLDKTLHVFGDRSSAAPGRPTPFRRMPLVYERAYGGVGVDANPVGVGAGPDARALPNVVDPSDARKPAGFGPIARLWKPRKSLTNAAQRKLLDQPIPELPRDFPWAYFQAAPLDQLVDFLEGDEWIVLDGMHPSFPRVQTRLPSARAVVHVHWASVGGVSPATAIALAADTLAIDADQQCCSVVWRSVLPVASEAALAALRIFAAVELPNLPATWPSPDDIAPLDPAFAEAVTLGEGGEMVELVRDEESHTTMLSIDEMARALAGRRVSPFVPPDPNAARPEEHRDLTAVTPARDDGGTAVVDVAALQRLAAARPVSPFVTAPAATQPPESTDATETTPTTRPPAHTDDVAAPYEFEDPATHTALVPIEELSRRAAERKLAPFALAPSGSQEPRAQAPLAGTPWGGPTSRPAPVDADPETTTTYVLPEAVMRRPPAPPLPPDPADAPTPAEPPARTGEVPRIINASTLTAATLAWQIRPPKDSLTIVVKGTFDIVHDAPARLRAESDLPIGDLHLDDDPEKSVAHASDFAVFKPKADVTLTGHAHAPGGRSSAAQVTLRFGSERNRFERSLVVFGERRWQGTRLALVPTEPQPFQTVPLVYERAFGGPGYDRNPVGVGHKATPGPDGIARLPNVELPGKLVNAPTDTPLPASFAPVPVTWKERWSKLGTYDRGWFRTRWPYFPDDFDWTHFQAAPPEQQLDHLAGDEPFELLGMHADHPALRGKLPGLRARAFVQHTKEQGGAFTEVRLALDTAAFDVDAMKLDLVWRGFVEVADEDAPEVQHVFVMAEALGDPPISLEEARRRYVAEATPKAPVPATPEAPPPANDERPASEEPDPEIVKLEKMLEEQAAARQAMLDAAGVSVPEEPATPPPPPDPAAIAATLRAGGASEQDIAAVLEVLRPPPDAPPAPAAPNRRAQVIARLDAGEPFDELNLEGADLADLDFSGRSLVGTSLRGASLARARFTGARLAGALLAGADLTEAVLDDAVLDGADVEGATIRGASFANASLEQADFSRATGAKASFAGATGAQAKFVEAFIPSARFEGARLASPDFSSASLDGASFQGAELVGARFYDACGEDVVFDDATLPNLRAEGASFVRGHFKDVQADGAVFERAKLGAATFFGGTMKGASLLRASCVKAIFSRVDLSEARLRRADLRGAVMLKTNLMNANLERADLSGADLRGANLHSAGLWKANLKDTKLDAALLTKSTLVMRRPS